MEHLQRKRYRRYQKNIHNLKKNNQRIFHSARIGIKSLHNLFIDPKTLEAIRRLFTRRLKRKGRVTVRIYPTVAVSKKGSESRMGKGKGSTVGWFCRIRRGEIFLEIDDIGKKGIQNVRQVASMVRTKFPCPVHVVLHPSYTMNKKKQIE